MAYRHHNAHDEESFYEADREARADNEELSFHRTPDDDPAIEAYRRLQRGNYPFNQYSEICWNGLGVGCDGCGCTCHSVHTPAFSCMEDVIEWHQEKA